MIQTRPVQQQAQVEQTEKILSEANLREKQLQEKLDNIDAEHRKILDEVLAREEELKKNLSEIQQTLDRERTSFAEMVAEERAATKKVF